MTSAEDLPRQASNARLWAAEREFMASAPTASDDDNDTSAAPYLRGVDINIEHNHIRPDSSVPAVPHLRVPRSPGKAELTWMNSTRRRGPRGEAIGREGGAEAGELRPAVGGREGAYYV